MEPKPVPHLDFEREIRVVVRALGETVLEDVLPKPSAFENADFV